MDIQKSKIILNKPLQCKQEQQLIQTSQSELKMNSSQLKNKDKQLVQIIEEQYLNQPHLSQSKSDKKTINFTISKSPKPPTQQNTQNINNFNQSNSSSISSGVIQSDVLQVSNFQSRIKGSLSQSQEGKGISDQLQKPNSEQTILVEVKPLSQVKNIQKKSQFLIEIPSLDSNEKVQDNLKIKEDVLNKSFSSFNRSSVQIWQKQNLNKSFAHNYLGDSIKNEKEVQHFSMRILPEDIAQVDTQKLRLDQNKMSKEKKILDVKSNKQNVFSNGSFNQRDNNNSQQLQVNNKAESVQNDKQLTQKHLNDKEKQIDQSFESKMRQKQTEKRNSLLAFQEKQQILQENADKRSNSIEDAKQISNHFNSINNLVKKSFESVNLQSQQKEPFLNQAQIINKLKINQKKRREDNNDKLDKLMDELIKLNQNKQNEANFNTQKKQKINEQQVNLDNQKCKEQDLLKLKQRYLNEIFIKPLQKCEQRPVQQEKNSQNKHFICEEQDSNIKSNKHQQRIEFQYHNQNSQFKKNQQDNLIEQKKLQSNTKNNILDITDLKQQPNNQYSSQINNIQRQNTQIILSQEQQRLKQLMLKVNQSISNRNNQILDNSNKRNSDFYLVANFAGDTYQKGESINGSNQKILSISSSNEGFCEIQQQDENNQNSAVAQAQQIESSLQATQKEKQPDNKNCMIIQIDSSKSLEKDEMAIQKEDDNKQAIASSSLPQQNQMMEKKYTLEIEIKKINRAIKSLGKKKLSLLKNRERKILKIKSYLIRQKRQIDLQLKEYDTQQLNQVIKQRQEIQQKMLEEMLIKQLWQQLNKVQNQKSYFKKSLNKCQFIVLNEANFDDYLVKEKQKLEDLKNKQQLKDQQEKEKNEQNTNDPNNKENPGLCQSDPSYEKKSTPEQNEDGDSKDKIENQDGQQTSKLLSQIEQDNVIQQQNQDLLHSNLQQNSSSLEKCNSQDKKQNEKELQTFQQQNQINLENQIQIEEEEIRPRSFQEENNDQQQFNTNQKEQAQSASPISMNQSLILTDNSPQKTPEMEGRYENNNNLNEINLYSSNTKSPENSNTYISTQNQNIESSGEKLKTENLEKEQQKQNVNFDLDITQIINVEGEKNSFEMIREEEENGNQNIQQNNQKINQQQVEIPQIGEEDLFFESKNDKQKKIIQETVIIDDLFEPENKIIKPKGKEQQININFKSGQENLGNDESLQQISQNQKIQVIVIDDLFTDRQIGFNKVQENIKISTQPQKQVKNNLQPVQIQQEQQIIKNESKQEMKIKKNTQENFFQTIIALIKTCSYFGLAGYYHTIYKMQEQQQIESQKQVQQTFDNNQQNQFGVQGKVQTGNQQYSFSFYKHPDNFSKKQNYDQQMNQNQVLVVDKQTYKQHNETGLDQSQPKIISLKKFIIKKKDSQNEEQINQKATFSQIKQDGDNMDLEQQQIEKLNCQKAVSNLQPKVIKLSQPIKRFKIIKK
ncbi:hypothetical protein ABPG74_006621 [Tetrahymena malaccensis]